MADEEASTTESAPEPGGTKPLGLTDLPFHLEYDLTRRQRLIPHLVIWARYILPFGVMAGAVVFATVRYSAWFLLAALVIVWLARGFLTGLLDCLLNRKRHMDIVVEENGLGFLVGEKRWWLFLDGIINIGTICRDTLTIQHHNGTVIHIPLASLREDQRAHLEGAAERGRTPEQVQEVLRRGRALLHASRSKADQFDEK